MLLRQYKAGQSRSELLVELADQAVQQNLVTSELREGQRPVPRADRGIDSPFLAQLDRRHKSFGHSFANFFRRSARWPATKFLRLRLKQGTRRKNQDQRQGK